MGNHQADKKFTWVIKNFNSLDSDRVYSDTFQAGRCKCHLVTYPKRFDECSYSKCYYLYLCVSDSKSLCSGWRRHAKFSLTMVNQFQEKLSHMQVSQGWFDEKNTRLGFSMFWGSRFPSRDNGFLINGEVKIVAEVDVLEVIDNFDEPEGNIDINGFQVPPLQVESVNSLFEKYPGFASKHCPKNQHMRKAYLNAILSLTENTSKSPEELSNGDLAEAYYALRYVTESGFKLDSLEKTLKETGETRLQEIEEESNDLKVNCADMDALLKFLP
ncbi:MATH domain and coiled-coil domain-containing protein At3g27040-like [Arabidopsis lyrata subsp. lyrata]|uniref:MATH domain and coiled-coil domain-containing protein At3g27040-like n=1 Tax=Arabidopsis lyrata subsp. lyrata TaxID=81972 RepID=UPI000A29D971|nr:MATH domain and coiled-coil domain-containing protein At3g27040-like [Arabidopsis lyrata subsp. lyrata]|eukprot:XP_020880703.1 MATH domain and coiled-coil domain-containing protein At3g27040-like [Arabidopsis lyrata subsp. lyrata]